MSNHTQSSGNSISLGMRSTSALFGTPPPLESVPSTFGSEEFASRSGFGRVEWMRFTGELPAPLSAAWPITHQQAEIVTPHAAISSAPLSISSSSSSSFAAAAALPFAPSPQPIPPLPFAASPPPSEFALNYDLMLGHVTHLLRGSVKLEARLKTMANSDHALKKYQSTFIDPFGTAIILPTQPWQLISDTLNQLQVYIPQHLKSWCKFGVRHHLASDVKPFTRNKNILSLTLVDPFTDESMRMTLAQANLVQYDEVEINLPNAPPSATPPSSAMVPAMGDAQCNTISPTKMPPSSAASSTSFLIPPPLLSIISYGELTVVLRNPLVPTSVSATRHAKNGSPSKSPSSNCRVHTFTIQVYGLDLLSDVRQRIFAYVGDIYAWTNLDASMYSVSSSFSIPLTHLKSTDLAAHPTELSEQQTIFSAQLAETGKVLLIEISNMAHANAANTDTIAAQSSSSAPVKSPSTGGDLLLTIESLSGRSLQVSLPSDATVEQLKLAITKQSNDTFGHLPIDQQKLVFNKLVLEDDNIRLTDVNIQDGGTLTLLLKLRDKPPPGTISSSPTVGTYHLRCGRSGLNPLSSDCSTSIALIYRLMQWSLPAKSKMARLNYETLTSILIHTRRLLCDLYTAIIRQTIYGHASNGKAWIDEKKIVEEAKAQFEAQQSDRTNGILIDENIDTSNVSHSSHNSLKRLSSTSVSDSESVIDLTEENENDVTNHGTTHNSRIRRRLQ